MLNRVDLEGEPISNYQDKDTDEQAVNVRLMLSLKVDPAPSMCWLLPFTEAQSVSASRPLNSAIKHQDAFTPHFRGLHAGEGGCSQIGNLSMLISFLETLLTVFIPKEKDEGGRCKGNKSRNPSRWESQNGGRSVSCHLVIFRDS